MFSRLLRLVPLLGLYVVDQRGPDVRRYFSRCQRCRKLGPYWHVEVEITARAEPVRRLHRGEPINSRVRGPVLTRDPSKLDAPGRTPQSTPVRPV